VRDTLVPGYQNQLDQLAYDVATQVNTISQAGFDAKGNAGGNFFSAPGAVAGAAAALAVNPAVQADSSLVVASSTGAAGDNGAATAIADLRNGAIVNGSTPVDAWGQLVYAVGSDVSTAQSGSTTSGQIVQQLQALQAQTSGVSMDEEAASLMKFQRSYEASARYFTTVVTTLDTLMAMVQ
jgi:flagellar hook-associated protein 1 FlgK